MRKSWLLCLALGCALAALAVNRAHAQSDDALPALVELIAGTDDPQFQLDLLRGMSEGLKGRRDVPMPAGWDAIEGKLAASPNTEVRALSRQLSLVFGSKHALQALRQTLLDPAASADTRQTALNALVAAKDKQLPADLQRLVADPALGGAALRGLAAYDDPNTPAAIIAVYSRLKTAEQRDALNTLASRAAYAKALLTAVEQGSLPRRDLTADVIRQLRTLKDEPLQAQIAKVWGVARETQADKADQIARYKKLVQRGPAGDSHRGRAVFSRVCQQCHTLYGVGGNVGPDITGSNRRDLDYLLQNVVDPNAVIPNDYLPYTLELADDRVITGLLVRQEGDVTTVKTANETLLLQRKEIVSRERSKLSMMPEGLLDAVSEEDVRDLVAYLATPGQVPMLATPDNLDQFFNGSDLTGWEGREELWKVEDGALVGKTAGLKENEWLSGPLWLGDFRLILRIKLTPNSANSGIQFRSQRLPSGEVKGYQADAGAGWWGKLYEEHGRGLLWKDSGETHVRPDDWNTYEIVAVGSRLLTAINGHPCVDLEDKTGATAGIIAIQLHAGGPTEVRVKDFQLELNPAPTLKTLPVP